MSEMYTTPHACTSLEAKTKALEIALAPFVFQGTYALKKLGILKAVGDAGEQGITAEAIAKQVHVSLYGVKVLLDLALSSHIVWLKDESYVLDKVGHFVLCDSMVQTNLDFSQDVCYQGLFHLLDAIKSGKPEGLKVFGDWPTIYPALSLLPKEAKKSWFDFDHFYSDKAFPEVLPLIFNTKKPIKRLFDIGGNTGKWAIQCVNYDFNVTVTIIDLPPQVDTVKQIIADKNLQDRIDTYPIDMLDSSAKLPEGADAIWVSQFLDCFSESKILSILQRIVEVMTADTTLNILELFYDRQIYEAAAFSINCTSIYFTAMANGNSRMYHSKDMLKLIAKAGLYVDQDVDNIGSGHTLLCCKKKP